MAEQAEKLQPDLIPDYGFFVPMSREGFQHASKYIGTLEAYEPLDPLYPSDGNNEDQAWWYTS